MPREITPAFMADTYTCPYCNVTAAVNWYGNESAAEIISPVGGASEQAQLRLNNFQHTDNPELCSWVFSECSHCKHLAVWHNGELEYPRVCTVGEPNSDMPKEVKECYLEAASVLQSSPRAAAALLRLGLQQLLGLLLRDESTGKIYQDIMIIRDRVHPQIGKALDIIRISGNESVHPGTIDLNDDSEYASELFIIMNMICEELISRPRKLDEAYARLPESKRIFSD